MLICLINLIINMAVTLISVEGRAVALECYSY